MSSGKKLTKEEFIERARSIHGDKYDYSKVEYINNYTKIEVICKRHGTRMMLPINLLSGHGCKICSSERAAIIRTTNPKCDLQSFIKRSKKLYGIDKFDYSKCVIEEGRMGSNPILICKIHGDFVTKANDHLAGKSGCPNCRKNKKKTISEILNEFKLTHGTRYNYDKFKFINIKIKGEIICYKHGSFYQSPEVHKNGSNCPKCVAETYISKKETYWLNNIINLPNLLTHRQVLISIKSSNYLVDGFDPSTNTIYEFYGDYWHGNLNRYDKTYINKHTKCSMNELYMKTLNKEQNLINSGFNLITIWETEFDKLVDSNQFTI